jgi:pimeloyl-ACP methyl ester carboxylesterase
MATWRRSAVLGLGALLLVGFLLGCAPEPASTETVLFYSGPFKLVGDLRLPEGRRPSPVVIFVHGDGPNSRTAGGSYEPIMARMHRAGYATFAWDKPGTGGSTGMIDRSRMSEQRAQIVLDAIRMLKERPEVDPQQIGLWGISQAGWVMPAVLSQSDDIAFMIAVSCAGGPGVEQGAYLVASQAVCAGLEEGDREGVARLLSAIEWAETYDEYVIYAEQLVAYPGLEDLGDLGVGFRLRVAPDEEWHVPNLEGEYFWDPMDVIEATTIPILAVFGEKDTQVDPIQGAGAYRQALERAGNPHSRVELFPGTDHNIILSQTGCLAERERRPLEDWTDYPPEYLDLIEAWLRALRD